MAASRAQARSKRSPLCVQPRKVRIACLLHLGDSRAYRLRDGVLSALTVDHSVGNALLARGLPEEEVRSRPNRNAITRAVGLVPRPAMTVRFETAAPGDVIVLSSDGLHRVVAEREIATIVAGGERAGVAAEQFIAKANERGGPDNVTAVVVRWPGAPMPPATPVSARNTS